MTSIERYSTQVIALLPRHCWRTTNFLGVLTAQTGLSKIHRKFNGHYFRARKTKTVSMLFSNFLKVSVVGISLSGGLHAAIVASLPGTSTQTFNSLGNLTNIGDGSSSSFDGADYGGSGLTNVDLLDATFALTVTLGNYSTADRQTIFETGGGTIGSSLNYEAGNVLVLRMSGDDGGGGGSGLLEASTAGLAPGTYDLIWTFDLEAGPGDETIALYIDGVLAATDSSSIWNTEDWSGGGTAGFGQQSGGNMAGDGSNGNISSVAFSDGSIDTTRGLEFYGDTLFVPAAIPEPGSLLLVSLVGLLAMRRRR